MGDGLQGLKLEGLSLSDDGTPAQVSHGLDGQLGQDLLSKLRHVPSHPAHGGIQLGPLVAPGPFIRPPADGVGPSGGHQGPWIHPHGQYGRMAPPAGVDQQAGSSMGPPTVQHLSGTLPPPGQHAAGMLPPPGFPPFGALPPGMFPNHLGMRPTYLPQEISASHGHRMTRDEAMALRAPLSRQLDHQMMMFHTIIQSGQTNSPVFPGLLQAIETTKAQLAHVAAVLDHRGVQAGPGEAQLLVTEQNGWPSDKSREADERQGSTAVSRDKNGSQSKQGAGKGPYKPAPGREGRWVDVMDTRHDGRRPLCDMKKLDAGLHALVKSLQPRVEEKEVQARALERVKILLKAAWPEAEVFLFGSAANGLAVRGTNDLDICMKLPPAFDSPDSKADAAVVVAEKAREAGMEDVVELPNARIPVVKFRLPDSAWRIDVTINNTLACANTRLLAAYAAIDPRFSELICIVKHWAKQRKVNESYTGTLSSYCYALMCLHLLQTRQPPILPCLQMIPHAPKPVIYGWDVSYYDDIASLKEYGARNRQTLADLVWDFFEYWAWRHDYRNAVVSVRKGTLMTKAEKGWAQRVGRDRHLVCIEDPFELSHDLGRTVDKQTSGVLQKEFRRAATILRDQEHPLGMLFERFKGRHEGTEKIA